MFREQDPEHEQARMLSPEWKKPSPDTLTKLIKRLRALTLRLLPLEVDVKIINDPINRIITPHVMLSYMQAAGDFSDALPYCLLQAHSQFCREARRNLADHGENLGRAVACEVLARRIAHQTPLDRVVPMITNRYSYRERDGEDSVASSALEVAIDNHCTIFLSSSEVQNVVASLWNGVIIQSIDENDDIQYVPYHKSHREDFWSHIDPSRMSVPRYQNVFRIVVWFIFLGVYSLAVREPIERLNPVHASLDPWEYALYIMALAFCLEDLHRGYKLIHYATRRSYGFWSVIALITNTLLLHAGDLRLKSFQILSFRAELVTVFDGHQYIGTMQICVSRMLQESGIFFSLLCLLGAGFLQAMYALDVADGQVEDVSSVINVLLQGLLQSPNYERFASRLDFPVGLALYYLWNLSTAVILLNILISLFASAYSDVIGDAEAEYMAFFAWKTVAMIRAPDSYAYPAPFNLVEILNRIVMTVIFFIPLSIIAFFEASSMQRSWVMHWLNGEDEIDFDNPAIIDPIVEGPEAEHGLQISKIPFNELARKLPNTGQPTEATILKELSDIQGSLHVLSEQIRQLRT
ncbi:hypothetical protein L210DRAFT_3618243 [Boletus edulis BED1]|uniref:YVC1 N-terminal linker helical domain-containing protein n=1 Tax=Boletus edulis BED1 TaxID=1328754 RepID=A0AAD4GL63_BOLED|nr:hypothetical protein L210DRAFT_3618243 [Boletus edulis BED1]